MTTNVLLCRWAEGFHEVKHQASIDAKGRREAFLTLGALSNVEEVERVARMQLDVVANPRTAIAADLAPIDRTDRPYFAFNVGDTIECPDYGSGSISQRVRAITGSEDDNGEITYSPELGDLILEEQERTLQAVKKMSDGTLEGDSPVAQPVLRSQPVRVWTTPAQPQSGSPGFTAHTAAPPSTAASSPLRSVPPGDGTYQLTDFHCVPATDGDHSDYPVHIGLWQMVPGGDGNFEAAYINLGNDYAAGIEYAATFVYDDTIVFSPEHGIYFYCEGSMTGFIEVWAEFEGGGTVINVQWAPERSHPLRVRARDA